jgi:hypothetical protein
MPPDRQCRQTPSSQTSCRPCCEPLAKHLQQVVDQLELAPGFVGVVSGHLVEDGPKLPRDDLGQGLGGAALERQHVGADRIEHCKRSGQALGQQQVVQAIGQCHRGPWRQAIGRVPRHAG